MPQKRILITGGAGFIGSELVRQAVAAGFSVSVADNLSNGRAENIEGVPDVELHVADVRDTERMSRLLNGTDIVLHLACLGVRHSIHSPLENHEVNASATLSLLGASRAGSISRFVYVSSSEVYGTAIEVPMTENHPTFPTTVYGASKLAGECYTRAYYKTFGFPVTVVRPFNAYGPRCHFEGDSGEVIPKFMLRSIAHRPMIVFGDGTQTRDFTFVSDTAAGILAAGLSDQAVGETINLGSGAEITINGLAAEIAELSGNKRLDIIHDVPRPGDVLRLYADTSKARRLLGFAPQVPFEMGLRRLLEWYLTSGESVEELLRREIVHNWEAQPANV